VRPPVRRQACVWLLLLGLNSPLFAASPLAEMVSAALQRAPEGALSGAENDMAEALQRKSKQWLAGAPSTNLSYQSDAIGSELGYREWEAGIEMPLWLPGQADSFSREADRSAEAADAMGLQRQLAVSGLVRERLWTAALARSEATQAEDGLRVARELQDDVQRRVEAGELARSDLLLARKDLLQREDRLQQARSLSAQAEQRLQHLTGTAVPQQLQAEAVAADVQGAILDQHPQLRLSRRLLQKARAHRNRVSRMRHSGPSLWLGGKKSKAAAGSDYASSVGVELSIPFGGAAHSAPEVAEAEAELTRAQVAHARQRLDLEETLAQARLELQRAATASALAQSRRQLAEESLKLSRRAFDLGETDLVRLLQAQDDALNARHDQQLRHLQHGQAIARLNQALGVIPQ